MNRIAELIALAAVAMAAANAAPAHAQGAKQTVGLAQINPATLASGYRSTKVVGSAVYNEANEQIGSIDDLIVTTNDSVPYAILSVGGFLGIDKHYVVVAMSALEVDGARMVLRGGTKESLKALPGYSYTN
ncbi:MAG: PRC-barrel domain-containing protein [Telmatospirillum sp.]|nr:PRC-barrel domain-containing protein [Telmatospirillum sp.]